MQLDTRNLWTRKIGAFELLCLLAGVELALGSAPRVVTFVVLAALVYLARRQLGGDFSLAQLKGLVMDQEKRS